MLSGEAQVCVHVCVCVCVCGPGWLPLRGECYCPEIQTDPQKKSHSKPRQALTARCQTNPPEVFPAVITGPQLKRKKIIRGFLSENGEKPICSDFLN